jgi:hypothetical protein
VAAWLSEKVLRGRGPDASGFESHRRGRIFSKGRNLRRAMDVCVCLLGADGRVVEGRINTLSATTARSARVRVPSGKGAHGCINVVVYVCECEVEWGVGGRGKVPRSPVASPEKAKEIGMEKTADRKVPKKAVWLKTGMAI